MPHFKDTQNQLYWLDENDDPVVWLPHCVAISDSEADAIRAAEQAAIVSSLTYSQKRAAEYPSITDQLDTIFHSGLDAWKEQIQAIKDKYPKQ